MHRLKYFTMMLACLGIAGCQGSQPAVLGHSPAGNSIAAIAAIKPSAKPQTIQGTMIDKCPVAGCWFHVKDSTGVMKVDTKNAGFVVTTVPINSTVVVTGIVRKDDAQTLSAIGMTYR